MIEHAAPISGIATFKEKYVATAGYDNQVILWDAVSGCSLARGLHDHLANQCTFSPDGTYLASSGSDYSCRIWHLPDMRLVTILGDHSDDVEGVAFHPEKPLIATSSRDSIVRVFDLDGTLKVRMEGHKADVISVAWVGNTDLLVSSSDDGTIKRWDAQSGAVLEDLDMGGIETDTIAITDCGVIIAGNDAGQIFCFDGTDRRGYAAHDAGIKKLVYDADHFALISLSYDRCMKIWHCDELGCLRLAQNAELPAIVWPRSCAFLNRDEIVFVTFGSRYATYNYQTAEWKLSGINPTQGYNAICDRKGDIFAVGDAGLVFRNGEMISDCGSLCNFLTDFGPFLVTGGQMGALFNAETGEELYQHHSPLNCAAAFLRNGQPYLVVGSYTGDGIIFHLKNDQLIHDRTLRLHANAIKGIAASPELIFSVAADTAAAFTSVEELKQTHYLAKGHNKIANGCAAMEGNLFVSISRDLKLRVWENFKIQEIATPHENSIKCIAITPDGRYICTGNYVGYVGIYDREQAAWPVWERLTASGISSLTLKHDGTSFLASSYDGKIYPIPLPKVAPS